MRLVLGEWEIAVDHFTRAMRLSPFDPMLFAMQGGIASGHFNTDRYYEAAVWSAKSIAENPKNLSAWRIAAASNALSGRLEQAQNAIARLRELDPNLRIATLKSVILSPLPDVLARMEHGLRKAGLRPLTTHRTLVANCRFRAATDIRC